MFKKLVYVFFICTLVASAPAAGLPPLIDELASEDYAARYKARMDLQAMLASASAPGADPALRAALEEGVHIFTRFLPHAGDADNANIKIGAAVSVEFQVLEQDALMPVFRLSGK